MARNDKDITAGKGDVVNGPLWVHFGSVNEDVDFSFDFENSSDWIELGEASTEGVSFSQEADLSEKKVWGDKTVGSLFSNFKDTFTLRLVSTLDADVKRFLYGNENVNVSDESIKTIIKNRQPEPCGIVIMSATDDGRKKWRCANNSVLDINLSEDWSDEDIVAIEATVTNLSDFENKGSYEIVENRQ